MTHFRKTLIFTLPATIWLTSSLLVTPLLSGCSKPRPTQFVDENLNDELVALSDLQKEIRVTLKTLDEQSAQIDQFLTTTPNALREALKRVRLIKTPQNETHIVLQANPREILVGQIWPENSQQPAWAGALVDHYKGKSVLWVASIPIKRLGVIEPLKTEWNEITHRLDLRSKPFQTATHAQIDLSEYGVKNLHQSESEKRQISEIWPISAFDNQVWNLDQLLNKTQVQWNWNSRESHQVLTRFDQNGNQSRILVYSQATRRQINDPTVGIKQGYYIPCGDDCYWVLEGIIPVNRVKLSWQKDDKGLVYSSYSLVANLQSPWIQVPRNSEVRPFQIQKIFQAGYWLDLSDFKNQVFFMRRTLEDVSAMTQIIPPGMSTNVDLVTFDFQKDRLVIKKLVNFTPNPKNVKVNQEELLSLPVTYYVAYDAQKQPLKEPIVTDLKNAQVAVIDWSRSHLIHHESILSAINLGPCFASQGYQTIQNVRQNDQGIHFTIQTSVSFNPGCMTFIPVNDYWHGNLFQGNFILKERFSFIKADLQKPLMSADLMKEDLPFKVQNLLGFGFFTAGRKEDDQVYSGKWSSQVNYLVRMPFQKGRTLRFKVGGLNDLSQKEKEAIVKALDEVFKDLNQKLALAFKGTSLEQTQPYVEYQLINSSQETAYGDLDEHIIWNFTDPGASGVIGLAQPGFDPRSGIVQSALVSMYVGNIKEFIRYLKNAAQILKYNETLKQKAIEEFQKNQSQPISQKSTSLDQAYSSKNAKVLPLSYWHQTRPFKSYSMQVPKISNKTANLVAERVKSHSQAYRKTVDLSEKWAWQKLVKELQKPEYLTHPEKRMIFLQKWLSEQNSKLKWPLANPSEMAREHVLSQIRGYVEKKMGCLTQMDSLQFSKSEVENALKLDETELLALIYAETLSHEIGHVLGLTHNFKGSFDKNHFHFAHESQSKRPYSSIMDYNESDYEQFYGLGPYDVAALRTGYTGFLQLENGGQVHLSQLKKALGLNQWWEFSEEHINLLEKNNIRLKRYQYCSDMQVGTDLTCMPFDRGTSAQELVQHYKQVYEQLFTLSGYPHGRTFGVSLPAYLSRLSQNLILLRAFLDEGIWRAVMGTSDAQDFLMGAFESYKTFMNIVSKPTLMAPFDTHHRFLVLPYKDKTNQTRLAVIETRPLNLWVDFNSGEIIQMGYEIDKALALQLLTANVFENFKYQMANLSLNYVHFENLVLDMKPANSLILNHILSGLQGKAAGYYFLEDNTLLPMTQLETSALMQEFYRLAPPLFLKTAASSMNWDMSQYFTLLLGSDNSLPQLGSDGLIIPVTEKGPYKHLRLATTKEAELAFQWLEYLRNVRLFKNVDHWLPKAQKALQQKSSLNPDCQKHFCLDEKPVASLALSVAQDVGLSLSQSEAQNVESMAKAVWNAIESVAKDIDQSGLNPAIKPFVLAFVAASLKEDFKSAIVEQPYLILAHLLLKAFVLQAQDRLNETVKTLAEAALLGGNVLTQLDEINTDNLLEVARIFKLTTPEFSQ